jgi:hypothetical protein
VLPNKHFMNREMALQPAAFNFWLMQELTNQDRGAIPVRTPSINIGQS